MSPVGPSFFIVEGESLMAVERVARRLFTETRMNGDEMRDAAQLLDLFCRRVRDIPWVPEESE